ncbi:MAG: hypothetical protein Q9201_003333 [Fulgogasparrea decipioides]
MENFTSHQKQISRSPSEQTEPGRVSGDIRSRIQLLLSSHNEKRPPATPCSSPASAHTAANSDDDEVGFSSARAVNLGSAHTRLSFFRAANPGLLADSYDGPAGQVPDAGVSGPRRRSTQRDVGDDHNLGADGPSFSTNERDSAGSGLGRNRGSLRDSSKKPDVDRPRRVRSTLSKTPTFPRRSLYNLKADSPPAEQRSQPAAETPNLRLNHVPGSYRSEYDVTVRTSRSASPVSVKNLMPVTVEPLQGRSFAAVSSREAINDNTSSSDPHAEQPSEVSHGTEKHKDERSPDATVPFIRPMLSSYTIREAPSTAALGTDPSSQPGNLQSVINRLDGQLHDNALAEAVEVSSGQAPTPDLRAESAVAVVELRPDVPSSLSVAVEDVDTATEDGCVSPRNPAMAALSDSKPRSEEQTQTDQADASNSTSVIKSTSARILRQPSPLLGLDAGEALPDSLHIPRVQRQATMKPHQSTRSQTSFSSKDREPNSKNRWMRQLLGQKSAPVMGQSPPNLTARPHHRSRKVTDEYDLQRSSTLPARASETRSSLEQPRGPESINRVITDLEGLLQQALHIAGQADSKTSAARLSADALPLNPARPRQSKTVERETSYESSDSSDEEFSSDSPGMDEEQNRTTTSRQYADRRGNHITLTEPDESERYHGHFKSHRHATPYPTAQKASQDYVQPRVSPQPVQVTIQGDPADVQNVLLHPAGITSSSVDTADWALKRQGTSATRQYPEAGAAAPAPAPEMPSSAHAPVHETQGFILRERRSSKTPAAPELSNVSVYSGPKSFSSGDDQDPIAYFSGRPATESQDRGTSQRRREAQRLTALSPVPVPGEDVLTPLPSDLGGHGPGSDPKSLDLKHRHHFSIREPKKFNLVQSHRRSPIARDWSTSKKRWVALVACINTALMGLIVGIYAGEVPAIQYNIVDEHHYAILGNVVLFIGLAITTSIFWPLPLLYGRKPFTLAALAILMPLQFPQAVAVNGYRTPYTPTYRVGLLLSRAVAGLVMGFANINFIATLLDLFGASLQSINPHQEIVNVNDVRRHGGGMGIWLGIWTWCFIGSIGLGFFIGAVIISGLDVDWGFWITIILTAFVLVLNVLVPEVRRSPYRRSVAEVRTPTELTRRVARGEVKMHLYSTGPKWWIEEVLAGSVLCIRMLKQVGFMVLSVYIGWIYGQIVMVIVLLGALTSRYYRFRPQYVGLCVLAIPIGALLAVPFQRASVFSRARQKPPRTDSMTVNKRLTWTSHFVRRAIFMVSLPFAGLAYTLASVGPQVSIATPTFFAGLIGFLSNLAIAECNGIIMETYDTSDLQPGMTGRPRRNLPEEIRKKRTNFSAFPRVTGAFAISQTCAFLIAAAATGAGGIIERRLGAQAATAVVAGILLILTLLLIAVVTRFKEIQIIPTQRYGTNVLSGPEDEWKPVIIGNPSGTTRRMSILELGSMTRWKEIRRRNRLTGLEGY